MRLSNLITEELPHLTYYHLAWHFCRASDRRKMERIQEQALHAVINTKVPTITY